MPDSWRRDGYEISTDRDRVDLDVVHAFLQRSYWSPDVARDVVERSIAGSLVFGVYDSDGAQVGFARVITEGKNPVLLQHHADGAG